MSAVADDRAWRRVSRTHPCPICGRPDWCGVLGDAADPELAICMRIAEGANREARNRGHLHVLRDDADRPIPRRVTRTLRIGQRLRLPLESMLSDWRSATTDAHIDDLAARLGVDPIGLRHLGACRVTRDALRAAQTDCYAPGAWAFPMRDHTGVVVGIRLRADSGTKWSVRGSRDGIFLPKTGSIGNDLTIIVEGPTDTAALLGLGLDAIGRPSCLGAVKPTAQVVRGRPGRIVILADQDAPGRRGAHALATALCVHHPDVSVVEPPEKIKDGRAWVNAGATADTILHWIREHARAVRVVVGGGTR